MASAVRACWHAPKIIGAGASFVVADKPAGQLSVPGRGPLAEGSLVAQVQTLFPEALTVHRLDMATSGLLLFALGTHWQRVYSRMFASRDISKRYVAVVHGTLGERAGSSGTIELPLSADWPKRPRQRVDLEGGKASLTQWNVLAHDPGGAWTRVSLTPVTGRSHQLRVHLMAIGHPIVGDPLYGPEPPNAPRLMLHAHALEFNEPASGTPTRIDAPAPF